MYKHLTVLACLALASATADVLFGRCNNITTVQDFDPSQYLGRWYEVYRYSDVFEAGMDCVTADYGPSDPGYITVTNTGTRNGELIVTAGNASVTEVPGSLIVYLPGGPPEGASYNVLGTDYAGFSSVFACEPTETPLVILEYAWILSRDQTISPELLAQAEEAFINNGVDPSLLLPTYQGPDCTYLPPPMPPTA